ncbi:hypothetical protein AB0B31_35330 [Catellatospora citrea]|uniref:hypothetical protein n=1 Tax=Catellatospora citrea TaxID=53366 RepID=UPI00340FDA67
MIAWSRWFAKVFPLHRSRTFLVSASLSTGMSFCGVLGSPTRSLGERSISSSSTTSHLKNCCRALCVFKPVDADRVSITHAWNAST